MEKITYTEKSALRFFSNEKRIFMPDEMHLLERTERNREVNDKHVTEMRESVERNGVIREAIIVPNKNKKGYYLIIDGQHLIESLKQLGHAVPCKIVEVESDEKMVDLMIDINNKSKSWSLEDYITSRAKSGNKDYKFILTEMERTGLQTTVVLMAYAQNRSRSAVTKETKIGSYKVANKTSGKMMLERIQDCGKHIGSSRPINQALVSLMLLHEEGYKHTKFLKLIKGIKGNLPHKEKEIFTTLNGLAA